MASTNPFFVSGKTGNTAITSPEPAIFSANRKDSGMEAKIAEKFDDFEVESVLPQNFRDPFEFRILTKCFVSIKPRNILAKVEYKIRKR
jgi:hypothetical protein